MLKNLKVPSGYVPPRHQILITGLSSIVSRLQATNSRCAPIKMYPILLLSRHLLPAMNATNTTTYPSKMMTGTMMF